MCVCFTLNRSFYPTTSVHPVSVLILHAREIQVLWSQTVRQRKPKQPQLQQQNKQHRAVAVSCEIPDSQLAQSQQLTEGAMGEHQILTVGYFAFRQGCPSARFQVINGGKRCIWSTRSGRDNYTLDTSNRY